VANGRVKGKDVARDGHTFIRHTHKLIAVRQRDRRLVLEVAEETSANAFEAVTEERLLLNDVAVDTELNERAQESLQPRSCAQLEVLEDEKSTVESEKLFRVDAFDRFFLILEERVRRNAQVVQGADQRAVFNGWEIGLEMRTGWEEIGQGVRSRVETNRKVSVKNDSRARMGREDALSLKDEGRVKTSATLRV
jgi:hypothetical protein